MQSPGEFEDVLAAFPHIEADTVRTILTYYGNDLMQTFSALHAMSSGTAEEPVRKTDRELINEWARIGRKLDPPFAELATTICIAPELMRTSRLDFKIAMLESKASRQSSQQREESFSNTAARLVQCAFRTRSPESAKTFQGSDPGGLARGNFYEGCMRVHGEIEPWQRPILKAAIVELMSTGDKDSLQLICGLLLRSASECLARKHYAFTTVVERSIANQAESTNPDFREGCTDLEKRKKQLMDAARVYVDELKDLAFRRAFTEPTKMYFRAVHDHTMEGDVEVHGSNTYLALLLASIGVKLPQTPLLTDEVKGIAPFEDGLQK